MTDKDENITVEIDNIDENGQPFFFWLGADGVAEPVTADEFQHRIEEEREAVRKWKEVDYEGTRD